jgi:hypothetical protein
LSPTGKPDSDVKVSIDHETGDLSQYPLAEDAASFKREDFFEKSVDEAGEKGSIAQNINN